MSETDKSTARGILTGVAKEQPLLSRLLDLYKGDTAFRGLTDFVAIGSLALMFLAPPQSVQWPWRASVAGSNTGSNPGSTGTSGSGGTGQSVQVAGLVLPIAFPQRVTNPSINTSLIELESRHFTSSSAADRPRLTAALVAFGTSAGNRIGEILREADGSDRNVALLRGIGLMLANTPADNAAALQQFRVSMEKGQPQARTFVAWMLRSTRQGIKRDEVESNKLLEASAAAGDQQAMRLLASGLLSGELGRVDAVRAYGLARRAADAGDRIGMLLTARLAADGIGTNANGRDAEAYLRKSAEAGLTEAQYALGQWLLNQYLKGLSSDLKEARDWHMRAYENGHLIDGLVGHAYILANAKGPPYLDLRASRSLLESCGGFAHGFCQNNLAHLLLNGQAGPVETARARAHFAVAAEVRNAYGEAGGKTLDQKLTPQERQAAMAYLTELKKHLRPMPAHIPIQYAEISAAPPVARAPAIAAPSPQPKPQTQPQSQQQIQQSTQSQQAVTGPQTVAASSPDLTACTTLSLALQQRIDGCTRAISAGNLTAAQVANAYYHRGYYRLGMKQEAEAEKDFDEAVKRAPMSASSIMFRGVARSALGRHQDGLADVDAALRINDKSTLALAYAWQGEILRRLERFDDALHAADRSTAIDANQLRPFLVRIDVHIKRKNWRDVVREATAGLGIAPNDQTLLRSSGDAYIELGEWQLAIAAYDQFIRQNAKNSRAFNQRGRAHFALGPAGYDRAIADFTQAIKLNENDSVPRSNRALVTAARGETDRAIADLDKAIELDQRNAGYLARRAALQLQAKRYDLAIDDLNRALELEPGSARHLTERGRARYLELVALQDFCAAARRQATQDATQGFHGGGGGLRCAARPDYESALQDLNAAAVKDGTLADPHFYAGLVLKLAGQHADAIKAFENSFRIVPGNGNAMVQAGHIWLDHFKNERKALEAYNEAIRVNARNADAYANRGNVLSRQRGNMERAIDDLRRALDIEPGHPYAKQRLDVLSRGR